jgi:hypothetical protein
MGRHEEPTQRVRTPQPPPAPLPGSLDPLREHSSEAVETGSEPVETGTGWVDTGSSEAEHVETPPAAAEPTGVLRLDEIFDGTGRASAGPEPATASEPTTAPERNAATEAPTWTAMPVVAVRSEPMPAGPSESWNEPYQQPYDEAAEPAPRQRGWMTWAEMQLRFEAWLRRDDNGLMLLTAVVACVLMIVVAGVGG